MLASKLIWNRSSPQLISIFLMTIHSCYSIEKKWMLDWSLKFQILGSQVWCHRESQSPSQLPISKINGESGGKVTGHSVLGLPATHPFDTPELLTWDSNYSHYILGSWWQLGLLELLLSDAVIWFHSLWPVYLLMVIPVPITIITQILPILNLLGMLTPSCTLSLKRLHSWEM